MISGLLFILSPGGPIASAPGTQGAQQGAGPERA